MRYSRIYLIQWDVEYLTMVGHAGSFQKGESRFECEREIGNFQGMRIAFSNCQLPRLPRWRKHGLCDTQSHPAKIPCLYIKIVVMGRKYVSRKGRAQHIFQSRCKTLEFDQQDAGCGFFN